MIKINQEIILKINYILATSYNSEIERANRTAKLFDVVDKKYHLKMIEYMIICYRDRSVPIDVEKKNQVDVFCKKERSVREAIRADGFFEKFYGAMNQEPRDMAQVIYSFLLKAPNSKYKNLILMYLHNDIAICLVQRDKRRESKSC